MSLIKLLKSSSKLFKKDVITFVIIKRYDLGVTDDKLRYIALKPSASISQLRQKVWHLLDLPDYCEEIIILKTEIDHEIPLTELRRGNDPQHPYIMEVWLPGKKTCLTSVHNMLTMGDNNTINNLSRDNFISNSNIFEKTANCEFKGKTFGSEISHTTIAYETKVLNNKLRSMEKHDNNQKLPDTDYKKSELSCKLSSSSMFFKLHGRKSRDNFVNILLKIQNDLMTLGNKLSDLEKRIHV